MAVTTAAVITVAATAYQAHEAKKSAKEAAKKDEEAQRVAKAEQQAQQAERTRAQIREDRVRRAQTAQSSENTGVTGSSGASGAMAASQTALGSNVASMTRQAFSANVITNLAQERADILTKSAERQAMAGVVKSAAGAFAQYQAAQPQTQPTEQQPNYSQVGGYSPVQQQDIFSSFKQ